MAPETATRSIRPHGIPPLPPSPQSNSYRGKQGYGMAIKEEDQYGGQVNPPRNRPNVPQYQRAGFQSEEVGWGSPGPGGFKAPGGISSSLARTTSAPPLGSPLLKMNDFGEYRTISEASTPDQSPSYPTFAFNSPEKERRMPAGGGLQKTKLSRTSSCPPLGEVDEGEEYLENDSEGTVLFWNYFCGFISKGLTFISFGDFWFPEILCLHRFQSFVPFFGSAFSLFLVLFLFSFLPKFGERFPFFLGFWLRFEGFLLSPLNLLYFFSFSSVSPFFSFTLLPHFNSSFPHFFTYTIIFPLSFHLYPPLLPLFAPCSLPYSLVFTNFPPISPTFPQVERMGQGEMTTPVWGTKGKDYWLLLRGGPWLFLPQTATERWPLFLLEMPIKLAIFATFKEDFWSNFDTFHSAQHFFFCSF